jgi:AcrR family transcriptional regulator
VAHIPSRPSTSKSRDARIERTLKALRDALLRLLKEQSFDQITIRDICANAGAGYATYFRHYPDKLALLNDLAAVGISELLERTVPILYAVDTHAACVTVCSYVDERQKLWSALLTGGAAGTVREEFMRQGRLLAAADARAAKPSKRIGSWLPADLAVVFGVSGVIEVLAWWLQHRRDFSVEEIAAILDRLVVAAILPPELRTTPESPTPRSRSKKRKR